MISAFHEEWIIQWELVFEFLFSSKMHDYMGLYESIYHFSCQLATLMDLLCMYWKSINVELKQNQSAEKSWMSINTSLEVVHAYILVSRAKTFNFSFFFVGDMFWSILLHRRNRQIIWPYYSKFLFIWTKKWWENFCRCFGKKLRKLIFSLIRLTKRIPKITRISNKCWQEESYCVHFTYRYFNNNVYVCKSRMPSNNVQEVRNKFKSLSRQFIKHLHALLEKSMKIFMPKAYLNRRQKRKAFSLSETLNSCI